MSDDTEQPVSEPVVVAPVGEPPQITDLVAPSGPALVQTGEIDTAVSAECK